MQIARDISTEEHNINNEQTAVREPSRPSSQNPYLRSFKRWLHYTCPSVLQQLTLIAWQTYGFLFFRCVVDLTASGFGYLYLTSQLSKVVTIVLIKCYTHIPNPSKTWTWFCLRDKITVHLFGSVGVLFFWPFLLAPCIGCIVNPSLPIMLLAYFFPFVFYSCFLTTLGMTNHFINETLPAPRNHARHLENVLRSSTYKSSIGLILHLVTWIFLAYSKGQDISTQTQSAFGNQTLFIIVTGFCTTLLYYLTAYDLKKQQKSTRKNEAPRKVSAEVQPSTPTENPQLPNESTVAKQKDVLHFASPWKLRCQDLSYLVSVFIHILSTNTFNIVLLLLPVYLIETMKSNKLSVANFPAVVFGGFSIGSLTVKKLIMSYGYKPLFCASSLLTLVAGVWFLTQTVKLSDLLYFPALAFGFSSCLMTVSSHMMMFISSKNLGLHFTEADDFAKAMNELWNGFVVFIVLQAFPDGHHKSHESKQSADFLRVGLFYVPAMQVIVAVVEVLFFLNRQDEISEENLICIQNYVKRMEHNRQNDEDRITSIAIEQDDLEKIKDLPASDV